MTSLHGGFHKWGYLKTDGGEWNPLYVFSSLYALVSTYTVYWVNYNDLTATSLESWLIRGIIPTWLYFRLVNYCNLPILLDLRKKNRKLELMNAAP